MKRFITVTALILCICLSSFVIYGCENSSKNTTLPTDITSTDNNTCSAERQQEITILLENWASAYSTHDLILYNDCVSENLEYPDNSENKVTLTENYFDTVTNCEIINVNFESCKVSEVKTYTVPVEYTITYNNNFKEENGLTKGKNNISVTMVIKESSTGEFYITEIN